MNAKEVKQLEEDFQSLTVTWSKEINLSVET